MALRVNRSLLGHGLVLELDAVMALSHAAVRTSAVVLLVIIAPAVITKEATPENDVSVATAPPEVLMPATLWGPGAANNWLDPLLVKAKNASGLDPMQVKAFKVVVPSDSWSNANFHADFSTGSAAGLSRMTRLGDCMLNEKTDLIECKLEMKNVHVKLKAEVQGDVFIPAVHPLVITSAFSENSVLLELKQTAGNNSTGVAFEIQNTTLFGEQNVQTSFIGTLSLSAKRLESFRSKLSSALIELLQADLLLNYTKVLNALAETNF